MREPIHTASARLSTQGRNPLPPRMRDVALGLYLQMYYWGRDVLHPRGNLLIEYGFRKIAKEGVHGTSRYQCVWRDGLIELHGHIAGWYRPGGEGLVFVRRRHACQLCAETSPVIAGQFDAARIWTPRNRDEWGALAGRTSSLLEWLADYEHWIARRCGPAYREGLFREYQMLPSKIWWLPPGEALAWYGAFGEAPESVVRARAWARKRLVPNPCP